jgi:hypothetical protein
MPSYFGMAFHIEDATALKADPASSELAVKFTAAAGSLISMKGVLPESSGPIRHQHAMGPTGDGVFRNSFGGRKVTAYEIIPTVT